VYARALPRFDRDARAACKENTFSRPPTRQKNMRIARGMQQTHILRALLASRSRLLRGAFVRLLNCFARGLHARSACGNKKFTGGKNLRARPSKRG
jgi:hypothetical protein